MSHTLIFVLAAGQIFLGLLPFLAAHKSAYLLGVPAQHDTPTTRWISRAFGVRDSGLGVLMFYGLEHTEHLEFLLLFNAMTNALDLAASLIPLLGRHGIDRSAAVCAIFAAPSALAWWILSTVAG